MPGKRPTTGPIVRDTTCRACLDGEHRACYGGGCTHPKGKGDPFRQTRSITPQPYDDSIGFESIPDECKKPEQRAGRHRAPAPPRGRAARRSTANAARRGGYHGSLLNVDGIAAMAATAAMIAGIMVIILMGIGLI